MSPLLIAVMMGCSTAKNTSGSRWWHAFNARYNTYYNGSVAYIDGSLEKENGNQDNFTEIIPLYTVGNKQSRELGKANFDRAIEKSEKAIHQHSIKRRPEWNKNRRKTARDIEWLNRREYNPFLWKAWMLMGRSQFHEGDFDGAASTFSYMSRLYETQPAINARARAWLAKSYVENGFLYDAEDVIRNQHRDSIPWQARKEWDYTLADYYLHTKDYEQAIPYLRNVIKHEMRRKQKAREWFLMGQICQALGRNQDAYKAYAHVIRLNPPYELEFNAHIAQTEVLAAGQSGKMISRLRRMARSDNNKEFLDQVYYAIGNIYLSQKDTTKAIAAYEQGNTKATRQGIEKGVLLLRLGDLYWEKEKFSDAQRCYGEAIGLLDKERPDYEQLSARSKVLDELVPYTEAVHLQDSLQELAHMDEAHRNAAIDRVIEALKKKEKEEQRARAEQEAEQTLQQSQAENGMDANQSSNLKPQTSNLKSQSNTQQATWYFYNPTAVQQGKQQFQRKWGKRENVDNWQRVNKTVIAGMGGFDNSQEELTDEQRDSLFAAQQAEDSLQQVRDSAQNDPHRREYYMAQIPFTPEQLEASNATLMDGLYHSGIIFKDKLDNLPLGERALRRLVDHYPQYDHTDEAFYHLFLLYSRMGKPRQAQAYVDSLKARFPQSQWTAILSDPNFAQNAREGVHLEDSLYAATYEAFKKDQTSIVAANSAISADRFPLGANRDKFMFIGALAKLNSGDSSGCLNDLDSLVAKYPTSKLSEMAGMIINGVKAGRKLRGGKFDIGDFWTRRTAETTDSAQMSQKQLSNERNTPFVFMLIYSPDSVNENKLLYQLARFNFTSFLVRDFDIAIDDEGGMHRMRVSGFRSYDEALQYARQLLAQEQIVKLIGKARPVIISNENLELLGTAYSYDDYGKFYNRHFAPLKVSTFHLLTEPAEVVTEPDAQQAPITEPEPDATDIDNFLNDTFIGADEPVSPRQGTTVISDEEPAQRQQTTTVISEDNSKVEPATTPQKPTPVQQQQAPATQQKPTATQQKPTTAPQKRKKVEVEQPIQSGGVDVILDDDELPAKRTTSPKANKQTGTTKKPTQKQEVKSAQKTETKAEKKTEKKAEKKPVKKPEVFDLDDEYYDLDGF